MTIQNYLAAVQKQFASGIAREHAYRPDFQNLLREILPDELEITNEPANVTDCGNPDFVLTNGKIPVGYIEAKDIGKDLNSKNYREQFSRYQKALDNLIITDYLWFQFFQNGSLVAEIRIAEIRDGRVVPLPENFGIFKNRLLDFAQFVGQTIKSAQKLAEMMAAKARLLQNILEKAVSSDEENAADSSLKQQLKGFRDILIHDLAPRQFADLYAQTLAYGMFAARLHDPTLDTFSRQEAADLIPKSNPFLRWLFQYVAGYDVDERIRAVVDNLAEVFRHTDVAAILKGFEKSATAQNDPIIHFYETFLAEYDPALRKSRGVWYTPQPVVQFLVRAVDDILKSHFGLPAGLADTSKTKIAVKTDNFDKRKQDYKTTEQEIHRVQILDPAAGTGTFLAEIIRFLHDTRFKSMPGIWPSFVEKDLVPRLHGFELLMASYAMAHLKLDLLLRETGHTMSGEQRLKIFLTNSLEEFHPDSGTLFAHLLAEEANAANRVKRDVPVMVVMGNPPYSVSSSNKGPWIQNLIADYKKDLNEKKINLDDDYIKFIRFGQYFIQKNGEGILAFITNNSFIDGITHRQMRKNLLETFEEIYILDLHGSGKKKETASDGSADQNVFDIMQGVSINIFLKTGKKKSDEIGKVFHAEIFGKREDKYDFLRNKPFLKVNWVDIDSNSPYFFFVPKKFDLEKKYENGFSLVELFENYSSGIETQKDSLVINFNEKSLSAVIEDFKNLTEAQIKIKYKIEKEGRDWKIRTAQKDVLNNSWKVVDFMYRPFDIRKTIYSGISKGFMAYPRNEIMRNHLANQNYSLIICKQQSSFDFQHVFITKFISEGNSISLQTKERSSVFPLYLYPDQKSEGLFSEKTRRPNLSPSILEKLSAHLGLRFSPEKTSEPGVFCPLDVLDYVYAVLHTPSYRAQYKEFLKIDFPRVPWPRDAAQFFALGKLGGELRGLHLLESEKLDDFITSYPAAGDNLVSKPKFDAGKVFINETQYFEGVPAAVWQFYIGGYQPAQKWLKDRSGRVLGYDDILHYQKMVVALSETGRVMEELDGLFG